jgi:predicted acylesterase/phospholipase RssA
MRDHVLFFGLSLHFAALAQKLAATNPEYEAGTLKSFSVSSENPECRECRFHLYTDLETVVAALEREYFDLLLIDSRAEPDAPLRWFPDTAGARLIEILAKEEEPLHYFRFNRIVAILPETPNLASEAFALGRHRLGGFIVPPVERKNLLDSIYRAIGPRRQGKTAFCLAGGGLEGIFFELGVLAALEDSLVDKSVCDFDLYCGISAGAILSCFLSQGIKPREIASVFADKPGRFGRISQRVIYDLFFREYGLRLTKLARSLITLASKRESLFDELTSLIPAGFFNLNPLEGYLAKQLTMNGLTNDFCAMKKELYIGATEQDTATPIVFGDIGYRDVPISRAVIASSALIPFYAPVNVNGRWYIDGEYTRTTNMHLAVRKGATLIVIIDPLVPVKARYPGFVRGKGGFFSFMQAMKSLTHTRFSQALRGMVKSNPEVDFIVFKPEADDMVALAGFPMRYNYRTEIIELAYKCTKRKLCADFAPISRDFRRHGFKMRDLPSPYRVDAA